MSRARSQTALRPVSLGQVITRRSVLKGGLVLSAAVAGLTGCSSEQAVPPAPSFPRGVGPDFSALSRRLRGQVILPDDPGYDSARVVFNSAYDYVRPLAIVRAVSVEDVQATIELARANDIELTIRSGGHSFAGYSTGQGIVLDVSPMNNVTMSADNKTARVGAGAKLIDVTAALSPSGMAIPSGWCPTVGMAGLSLGGGIGKLTRMYGLTCDSLQGIEMVTADGHLLRASGSENPDLFWASQGGGGGNFGVVTSLNFALKPVSFPCNRFEWTWPWSVRKEAFVAFQDWMNAAPRHSTATFVFKNAAPPATEPEIIVEGVFYGPQTEATKFITSFEATISQPPTTRKVDVVDYLTIEKDVFCPDVSIEQCKLESASPPGAVSRYGTSIKSDFIKDIWPPETVDVISEALERRQRDPLLTREPASRNLGKIWLETLGGAVSDTEPQATAYAHRDATFLVQYQSRWSPDAPAEVQEANIEWCRGLYAALSPFNSGAAYVNYQDPDLKRWGREYYAQNFRRLERIKSRVDPHNFFNFPQSIPSG